MAQIDVVRGFGAVGDGRADDTNAFHAAISAIVAGDTLYVPPGTYMIDATKGVRPKSDMTIKMYGATLKAIPNDQEKYSVIRIDGVSNVKLYGGIVAGERDEHKGKSGEWGMGVDIRNSKGVLVQDVTATKCWGDGFYMGSGSAVILQTVLADGNRRQGLSIISVDGMTVLNSTFRGTKGTAPSAGIDIEPDKDCVVHSVIIKGCALVNNAGAGIEYAPKRGKVSKVSISGCHYQGNGVDGIKRNDLSGFMKVFADLGFYRPTTLSA